MFRELKYFYVFKVTSYKMFTIVYSLFLKVLKSYFFERVLLLFAIYHCMHVLQDISMQSLSNQMQPMANSWMRILDMKYLRVFVMRLGLLRVYVMHAFV